MSKSRGLLPLALAIAFGIVNGNHPLPLPPPPTSSDLLPGVATFGPAFKDQAREKLERKL